MDAIRPDWGDIEFFLALAQHRSLPKAAAALRCNPSTVLRRIDRLETLMRVRLFHRHSRGFELNPAGETLLERAEAMESELIAASRQLSGQDDRIAGRVRLATVDDFAVAILPPIIAGFHAQHPEVQVELAIRREFTSLTRRESDIALRLGPRPTGEDLVVRRVSGARVALFCRHDRPQPQTLEQLREQPIVAGDEGMARTPMERWMTEDVQPRKLVLRSDSMLVRYHAVRSGVGIGFCPLFLAASDPELVRLPVRREGFLADLWLVVHVDLKRNARVRAFAEFLADGIAAQRERLEGTAIEA